MPKSRRKITKVDLHGDRKWHPVEAAIGLAVPHPFQSDTQPWFEAACKQIETYLVYGDEAALATGEAAARDLVKSSIAVRAIVQSRGSDARHPLLWLRDAVRERLLCAHSTAMREQARQLGSGLLVFVQVQRGDKAGWPEWTGPAFRIRPGVTQKGMPWINYVLASAKSQAPDEPIQTVKVRIWTRLDKAKQAAATKARERSPAEKFGTGLVNALTKRLEVLAAKKIKVKKIPSPVGTQKYVCVGPRPELVELLKRNAKLSTYADDTFDGAVSALVKSRRGRPRLT